MKVFSGKTEMKGGDDMMKIQRQEVHPRPPRVVQKVHPQILSLHGKPRMFSRRLESRKGR
ncbi:MAG: hypothetical protein N2115_04275 [bacterium]|nr:hypothetical protein [bacterium]